jgi:hypothetical protein
MYAGAGISGNHFGAGESKTWLLGIGDKFGVTTNGEIYATAGKIGTMTITEVNSGITNA